MNLINGENMKNDINFDIDFVITWVDGNDPLWLKEYRKYKGIEDEEFVFRYRNWDFLRYWFRGVEENAPWVRKIHFVTWGHIPSWLDTSNPKINIVKHEDFIPSDYLPTFKSTSIELFFHNIEGLAEHFVYFNDDFFCINPVGKDYYFNKDGKPMDMLSFEPICAYTYPLWGYMKLNVSTVLARHFNKIECIKNNKRKYFSLKYPLKYRLYNFVELFYPSFTSFIIPHNPSPMLKSVYEKVWAKEREVLEYSCENRFRTKDDFSQVLFRHWNLLEGNFIPVNPFKYFKYCVIGRDDKKITEYILGNNVKNICINDGSVEDDIDFEKSRKMIADAFEKKFPDKCSFEKENI